MNQNALDQLAQITKSIQGTASKLEAVNADKLSRSFVGFHLDEKAKRQIAAIADAESVTLSSYLRDLVHLELLRAAQGEESLVAVYRRMKRKLVASKIEDAEG